jgi:hypothetical protein
LTENPYAYLRNTATLERHRARLRAANKAALPFFTLWILATAMAAPLLTLAFMRGHGMGRLGLALLGVLAAQGLAYSIAMFKRTQYLREHPEDADIAAPPLNPRARCGPRAR